MAIQRNLETQVPGRPHSASDTRSHSLHVTSACTFQLGYVRSAVCVRNIGKHKVKMARPPRVLVLLRFFAIVSAWEDIFNLNIGINLKNTTGNVIRSLLFGAPSDPR